MMRHLPPGPKPPHHVYCFVEIPRGDSNKYEYKSRLNAFVLDRVLYGAVFYPTEYGFIPATVADDGDELDIMVITTYPTFPGCVLDARVVGGIEIIDSGKIDYKIIAVAKNDPRLSKIKNLKTLPSHFCREVEDFWQNYARLQPKKDIKTGRWLNKLKAYRVINDAIVRHREANENSHE